MTKIILLSLLSISLLVDVIKGYTLMCNPSSSASPENYYCLAVDNGTPQACQQCAAGVKYFCPTSPTLPTSAWKKGINVLQNCNNIQRYTAIATFSNGVNYGGHAAVFISCSAATNTINVYDQYEGKKWSARSIWNTQGSISNNPKEFYVVTI